MKVSVAMIAATLGSTAPLGSCVAQDRPVPTASIADLVDAGRLDAAEATARTGGDSLVVTLADILVLRGRLAAAESLYAVAIARGLPGVRVAKAGRAEIAARRHDARAARRDADALVAAYEQNGDAWSATDRIAAGRAYLIRGTADPAAVRSALAAFDAAAAADSTNIDARLRAGDLLLDRYNAPDAKRSYAEVLVLRAGHPRAHTGLARAMAFEGDADAIKLVRRALAFNPSLVPARLLLARIHLEAEAYDSALNAASAALAVDSTATAAWATVGAVAWMRGDSSAFRMAESGARRVDPAPADFYVEIAEAAARHRRYGDAVLMARRAVAVDSLSAQALGVLGMNALRVGDIEAGRRELERAFALDPFHVWNKNTLDLLDAMGRFRTVDVGRFRFVAPAEDIELMVLYLGPLLEEAYVSLAARYAYRPPTPIRFEVYRSHADFSVRTVGLAGLGALGVSFGTVLAMDAPAARPVGDFNFGSTAWHELAHTFTLGLSNNRVPRWISEGLSVLEERRARRGWGADVSLQFLGALKAGRILPVSRINEGLVRPSHPLEIGFSYYQASLVCEMIEAERGIAALRSILTGYRDGWSTAQVFQRVLRMTPDSLDRHFAAWMARRFATPLAAIDPWSGTSPVSGPYVDAVRRGRDHLTRGEAASARAEFERAHALFPGYGGSDAAGWWLAQARVAHGDSAGAVRAVSEITARSETAALPNAFEAALREQTGDERGAVDALERLVWITPQDPAVHIRLAELSGRVGDHARAVRERRAVLALAPADRLDARYQLARSMLAAGDRVGARREVIAVLEQAPTYEKAQDLLLTLSRGLP